MFYWAWNELKRVGSSIGDEGGTLPEDPPIPAPTPGHQHWHDNLLNVLPDQHHNRSHNHSDPLDGIVSHTVLSNITPDDHHNELHTLDSHTDVTITAAAQEQSLAYDSGWKNDYRMKHIHPYAFGDTYYPQQAVLDEGWTMVANKETSERAAPQPTGAPFNAYAGLDPTAQAVAKQLIMGNRYTFGIVGFLQGYRIYTITGNSYSVFSVRDPAGSAKLTELLTFTASVTGWVEFGLDQRVVSAGTVFDLLVVVQEPDPTPTTFVGNWNYTTPNNPSAPTAGVMVHANTTSSTISIHKTDSDAVDRTADLSGLTAGDIIDSGNIRWAIQAIADQGAYYDYAVAPATQDSPDGVRSFTFETVTATPITHLSDTNYWGLNPFPGGAVEGLYIADGLYGDIIPDTSAYGVDLTIQRAVVSEDWDLLATSGVTSSTEGSVSGQGQFGVVGVVDVTNDYTVPAGSSLFTLVCNNTIPIVITLTQLNIGVEGVIMRANTGTVQIATADGSLIQGETTQNIPSNGDALDLIGTDLGWRLT